MTGKKIKAILNLRRIKQYGETTLGKLTIEGIDKSWFVLEPGGPDSIVEGSDKRISAGTYKVEPFSGTKYKKCVRIKKMFQDGLMFLIHAGNYHKNTEGCLMPGKKLGSVKRFSLLCKQ
ncbi:DUF5675 family protein [Vibrio harveyi]|uniref:DUF5675 family protein n=1 Tax=Vibrio harveyi TaxID=669 RepID=UPI00217D9900|nr:DUF5675 family protein [Vibrio harveyi]